MKRVGLVVIAMLLTLELSDGRTAKLPKGQARGRIAR